MFNQLKNRQHQTLNEIHSMLMKWTNITHLHSMKGPIEKLKTRNKTLPFCCDKCLIWLSQYSSLNFNLNSSNPSNFVTCCVVVKWSLVKINTHIPTYFFIDLITIATFPYK
jgi:hypothetical protein